METHLSRRLTRLAESLDSFVQPWSGSASMSIVDDSLASASSITRPWSKGTLTAKTNGENTHETRQGGTNRQKGSVSLGLSQLCVEMSTLL